MIWQEKMSNRKYAIHMIASYSKFTAQEIETKVSALSDSAVLKMAEYIALHNMIKRLKPFYPKIRTQLEVAKQMIFQE